MVNAFPIGKSESARQRIAISPTLPLIVKARKTDFQPYVAFFAVLLGRISPWGRDVSPGLTEVAEGFTSEG